MIQPSIWDNSKKVVIIGGVAAGSKVASKVIRLSPDTEVTVIEKGDILSYSGCGLPYYVSGVVSKPALLSTAVRELRSPALFSNVKNVVIYNKTECIEIDREKKKIKMRSLINSNESWISYDKLVLATGSCPLIPDIKNVRVYKEIYTLHGVNDAEEIKAALAPRKAKDVVIVGGGLIGVEMTEALVARGCRVTIIEQQSRILNGILDEEVSLLVERHMEEHGVRIMTDTSIKSFYKPEEVQSDLSELKKFSSSRRKLYVTTERETIAVDFVIIAAGVVPNVELARKAGLELGITGALKVDKSMRTSDPDIYAAGDCAEAYGIVDGNPYYMPLGSTANKEGRVAAVNLCGGEEIFHGINGTVVCKVFDFCVARTGLKESMALAEGYETVSSLTSGPDREHFMPGAKKTMMLKLIVNKKTRTVLGAQSIGTARGFGKIDVIATAMAGKLTIDEIANLDFCYAPSYSLAMDSVITAANVAKNKIDGIFEWITTKEVYDKINKREEFILLDVRSHNEFQDIRIPGSILIPLNALRGRIHELPYDSEIVVYCSISLRGYEAALILKAANFKRVKVMDGGIAMWPYDVLRGI
ncbi:MAG: hypothetical protein A2X47_10150 [Lentisphaerae bacterium GWF2_38_69]|nr:MAG: hypothetical protein A2X47_10150 [Lentisphaerae bacterium GWF2_38_69]